MRKNNKKISLVLFGCAMAVFALLPSKMNGQAASKVPQNDSGTWVNVSESLGFPLGGIGTGYSAFGKYGFVRVNFDDRPKDGLEVGEWEYNAEDFKASNEFFQMAEAAYKNAKGANPPLDTKAMARAQMKYDQALMVRSLANAPEGFVQSDYGFTITEGEDKYIVQTTPAKWKKDAQVFRNASVKAYLPKGEAVFSNNDALLQVTVSAFTPLLPYDLANSTLPVQVFDVSIKNTGVTPRQMVLSLENSIIGEAILDRVIFKSATGEMVFAANDGKSSGNAVSVEVSLAPGDEVSNRFYVAWYYPKIDNYKRYYTLASPDASAVIDRAMKDASGWSQRINTWHNSIQAPSYLKRIWFGSLASIMTSTFMTTDPYFFEIETPHPSLNTMDVSVYCGWVYMLFWPELEKMDMKQYFKATRTTGEKAGLILHSLWWDEARYVEEPTFMCRVRRDALWFNDTAFSHQGFNIAVIAANRVYNLDNYQYLVNSKHGNQSYDIWKMPGVSSYVNSAWVYGLDALNNMAMEMGKKDVTVGNMPVGELLSKARASYDKVLWNPQSKAWNLFYRTEGASSGSTPESMFTDQLFGLWVTAIDNKNRYVLPSDKINTALHSLYSNNLVEDKAQNFRGWSNGMLPNRIPDVTTGYHARTCWFGAQINLGSLLGFVGNEAASLDIMRSMDMSLKNNHLAAGEWNGSINAKGEVLRLPEEKCKDTPRFAPYPRYKSSWEYVVRMLGLQMDEKMLYLQPYKTVGFSFQNIELAGKKMSISVESGWDKVLVNGKKAKLPLKISRTDEVVTVQFLK